MHLKWCAFNKSKLIYMLQVHLLCNLSIVEQIFNFAL